LVGDVSVAGVWAAGILSVAALDDFKGFELSSGTEISAAAGDTITRAGKSSAAGMK
jgi:hypothetical protein